MKQTYTFDNTYKVGPKRFDRLIQSQYLRVHRRSSIIKHRSSQNLTVSRYLPNVRAQAQQTLPTERKSLFNSVYTRNNVDYLNSLLQIDDTQDQLYGEWKNQASQEQSSDSQKTETQTVAVEPRKSKRRKKTSISPQYKVKQNKKQQQSLEINNTLYSSTRQVKRNSSTQNKSNFVSQKASVKQQQGQNTNLTIVNDQVPAQVQTQRISRYSNQGQSKQTEIQNLTKNQQFFQQLGKKIGERRSVNFSRAPKARLDSYISSRSSAGLLTRDEEIQLFKIYFKGVKLEEKVKQYQEGPLKPLSKEQIARILDVQPRAVGQVQDDMRTAQALMIQFNFRLIVSVANRFKDKNVEMMDLLNAGENGLNRAIQKFDLSRNIKFSTYAYIWIKQCMVRYIQEYSRPVRLPGHIYEIASKIFTCRTEMRLELQGQEPSWPQVAERLEMPLQKCQRVLDLIRPSKNMDDYLPFQDGEKGMTYGDLLADPQDHMQESVDNLHQEDCQRIVKQLLEKLEPRERNIIKMRNGLSQQAPLRRMTYHEIAQMYGLSHETVRIVEKRAVQKLDNIKGTENLRMLLNAAFQQEQNLV